MGIKITKKEYELHPEGWFLFCIKGAEEASGALGPRIKWALESSERMEDGTKFSIIHWTGFNISSKSLLGKLAVAVGLDDAEELDADEFIGSVFEGLVIHKDTDKGTFANITEVRKRRPKPKSKAKVDEDAEEEDPFANE